MKKDILIIRCANGEVTEKVINYINNKYRDEEINIHCLIQKSSTPSFKQKYPFIKYIEKEDGIFSYKIFKKNRVLRKYLKNLYFYETYIPSSYIDYPDFNDVFIISSKIRTEKTILFNCNEEMIEKKMNFIILWVDKYLGEVIYLFKVLFALVGISIIYLFYYPYYFIKRKLLS